MSLLRQPTLLLGAGQSRFSLLELPLLGAMAALIQFFGLGLENPLVKVILGAGCALLLVAGWCAVAAAEAENLRWVGAGGLGLLSTISILTVVNLLPQLSVLGVTQLIFLCIGLLGYFLLPGSRK